MRPVRLMPVAAACLLLGIDPAAGRLQDVARDPASADFFVSPKGKDTWSGKRSDPGEEDGPFATVGRASEAVRALLGTLDRPRAVRVVLRAGTYHLDAPLEFGPED